MKRRTFYNIGLAIGACAVLAGCGAAGDEGGAPAPGTEHPEPGPSNGPSFQADPEVVTVLATVRISDTHRVDFFEIGRGDLLIQEDRHADEDGAARTDKFNPLTDSPLALYLDLARQSADSAVVERLTSFEARFAEARAARAANNQTQAAPRSDISAVEAEDMVSKNHSPGSTPPGWNWDADASWFVSNFCTLDGLFHCQANMASFRWLVQARSGRTNFFNQSFGSTATFTMAYDPCDFIAPFPPTFCTKPFKTLFTLSPMPRHILSQTFTGDTSWSSNGSGNRFGLTLNFF
jgi:hypothetical protein